VLASAIIIFFLFFFSIRDAAGPSNERMQIAAMTLSVIFNTGLMVDATMTMSNLPSRLLDRSDLLGETLQKVVKYYYGC